jgi:hypothetical protein
LGGGKLDVDKVLKMLKRDVLTPPKFKFPTLSGEIGFEHGGLNSFRHYFVTQAFLGGATDGEVRDWFGHRHLRDRDAKRTMNRLDFLGEKTAQENQTPSSGAANGAGENDTSELKGGPKVDEADELKINGDTDGPSVSAPQ